MSEQSENAAPGSTDDRPYTVVVGVSATSKSPTALTWAAHQAAQNAGRLVAVRAWRSPSLQATTSGPIAARMPAEAQLEADARKAFEADVADVLGEDHDAELQLVRGGKRKVLLRAAEGADLLVVDSPRALTGSPLFAQRIVGSASCPVVVMPPRISGQPQGAVERAGRAVGRAAVRSAGTAGRPGYRPPPRRD